MKKIVLIGILTITSYNLAYTQAVRLLNFGGLGTGIYMGYELPVASAITVVPQVSTDYNFKSLYLAAKGNFYFDSLFELPSEWDIYGGINMGFKISTNSGFDAGAQVGGRWYWTDKWAINAEFGGGTTIHAGVGVSMKL